MWQIFRKIKLHKYTLAGQSDEDAKIVIATRDATNASLNALAMLLSRHIVTGDSGGTVACRHRVMPTP
jgi:hypothetical protein